MKIKNNREYTLHGMIVTDGDFCIDLKKLDSFSKYIICDGDCYEFSLVQVDKLFISEFLRRLVVSFDVLFTHYYLIVDLYNLIDELILGIIEDKPTTEVRLEGNYSGTELVLNIKVLDNEMTRFTEKIRENDYGFNYAVTTLDGCRPACEEDCLNKLGPLEDIEEKIGVDLITLLQASEKGIFVKEQNTDGKEIVFEEVILDLSNKLLVFRHPRKEIGKGRNISRYGKTWALTKEELEE